MPRRSRPAGSSSLEDGERFGRAPHRFADDPGWDGIVVRKPTICTATCRQGRPIVPGFGGPVPSPRAEADLGRSIHLVQRHAEALPPALDQLARRAGAERPRQSVVGVRRCGRLASQVGDDGAEVAHPRRPAAAQVVPEPAHREGPPQHHRVADPEGGRRTRRAAHLVEQREHRVADVAVGEVEALDERHDVVQRADVVVHDALRRARRP